MKVIKTIAEVRSVLSPPQNKTIGLVPTMGALHKGHLSLVRQAKKSSDIVVVSIFVNPIQFGPTEDFSSYPRNPESDYELLEKEKVDYVFAPETEEMYKKEPLTLVTVKKITKKLCGASRPEHFGGVATVVTKLFNIVRPNIAYFGQKDYQQFLVIRKMVRDLNFPIKIIMVPIEREPDGLARSSRNQYLSEKERNQAVILFQSLKKAREWILDGEDDIENIKSMIRENIKNHSSGLIDYVEILDAQDLSDIETIDRPVIVALAVWFGQARLIDNTIIEKI